jgi:hypothetical protein
MLEMVSIRGGKQCGHPAAFMSHTWSTARPELRRGTQMRNGADIIAFLYASNIACGAGPHSFRSFVPRGAMPRGSSPWSLPLYPSVARVEPIAEYIHQLAGVFRVNCDLHQLSPGIIVGDNGDFIPVFLSVSRWADLLPEIRSLLQFPLISYSPLRPSDSQSLTFLWWA